MKNNKKWFSVLVSILIIGFLMVLTVWTFNIVLRELNDSKWAFDYLKAYSAAEAAWELALLKIKEKGYWYYDKVDLDINDNSVVLSKNPTDKSKFIKAKEALISYDLDSKTNSYDWNLWVGEFDIIPLFYIDKTWEYKAKNIKLKVKSWSDWTKLTWNIVGKDFWIWWLWEIDSSTKWKWRFKDSINPGLYIVEEKKVSDFLNSSDSNYLILMNIDPNNNLEYTLSWDTFTKPRTNIKVSWKVGKYKQNLNIFLDNTEYLWRSRYSIYSN
jgi:hypothetical protein